MGSLLSHEERDEDGALDDASSFPSRNNDADVMHRIVDEMHSSSCGDRTSEPGNCCVALSRQLTVLKAAIKHNINGDADQFSAEAAADVTPQTSRDAHRISMWIDDVLAIAAAFTHELDCPVTMFDNEQRLRRDSKRRRRASHSTVPAASYIVDPQLDVPPTVDKEPHRTAIAAVAAIAMARVQRHGPSQGGVIPESEDDESQPRESHRRHHRQPKNDLKVIIQHGRSRSRSGDDLSDGSLSLHQSVSTGVASSPHYPSTTLGDARIHTDVLSRAYHLKQQRNIQRQARARSRHRRGSMTRSASGVTCTTESSGASSMDVFELGAAEDDFPEQHIAIASPREQSASRSLSNLHFSGSNHAARRPPRPRKMSAGGDPPLSGRNAGSARRASATLDSAH